MGASLSLCRTSWGDADQGDRDSRRPCASPNAGNSGDPSAKGESEVPAVEEKTFPQFGQLSDDLVVEVLSFISYGPYEHGLEDAEGTLTHVLPLVCRQFREYCDGSESLWMPSLERLVSLNPDSWGEGVRSVLSSVRSIPLAPSTIDQVYHSDGNNRGAVRNADGQSQGAGGERNSVEEGNNFQSMKLDEIRRLLNVVCKISSQEAYRNRAPENGTVCDTVVKGGLTSLTPFQKLCPAKLAYRSLITKHMMVTMPVFYMPSPMQANQPIGLHFFEPRYRQLIAEVTAGRSANELSGGQMSEPLPLFVFACNSPLASGTLAFVVEVHRCRMYVNGRADVLINPVKSVRLVKVVERIGSGGLCDVVFRRT